MKLHKHAHPHADPASSERAHIEAGKLFFKDDRVRVVSDTEVTAEEAETIAHQVEDALTFAADQNGRAPDKAPITVVLLSEDAFVKAGGDGAEGLTTNKRTFLVPMSVVGSQDPDVQDTFAHELDHIQDFRAAKGRIDTVPTYIQEGKAYSIGDAFPINKGTAKKTGALRDVANQLASITREQAADTIANYRTLDAEAGDDGFRHETTGALFVQWLNGKKAGAVGRIALAIGAVGTGATFETAFKKMLGMSLPEAEQQFIDFIGETEGNPEARLQGTMWAPYYDPSVDNSAPDNL